MYLLEAVMYLGEVEKQLRGTKEKFIQFLKVMKDYGEARVDIVELITRVKDLFEGHRQLIVGFNTFVPPGYEITLPVEEEN